MLETLGVNSQEALKTIKARRMASSPTEAIAPNATLSLSSKLDPHGKDSSLGSAAAIVLVVLAALAIGIAIYVISGHAGWRH
jgi:hypothetical protein